MTFKYKSNKTPEQWYFVDIKLGSYEYNPICTLCKYQLSIAIHYHICDMNQIPIMSVNSYYQYAYLVLDDKCKELSFYANLHQV